MARREGRLAYALLAPTFLIVFAVVLFPLLANFWISFKPVGLAELRPPALIGNERLRGDLAKAGDEAVLEYRLRNSSPERGVEGAFFTDVLPEGLSLAEAAPGEGEGGLAAAELCDFSALPRFRCDLGDLPGGWRERLRLPVRAEAGWFAGAEPPDVRASAPSFGGRSDNILTNFEFTLENFRRVFDAREFWLVLRVSLYYTVFGTAGALILGLFAAQLLNTTFAGRGILRGLFLFPYVAPIIAVAFTWTVLLDPFSGIINELLQETGATEGPVNFLRQALRAGANLRVHVGVSCCADDCHRF